MDFRKAIPSLVNLIASIGVEWLIWGGKLKLMELWTKYEKWGEYWLKNTQNWAKHLYIMPFWTKLCPSWYYTFITHFKMYQMSLSNQFDALNTTLNHAASQLAKTFIDDPSRNITNSLPIYLKHTRNQPCTCSHQGLFILISATSLRPILLSCTLHQIYLLSVIMFWTYNELIKLGYHQSTYYPLQLHLNTQFLSKYKLHEWVSFTYHPYVQFHVWNRVEA